MGGNYKNNVGMVADKIKFLSLMKYIFLKMQFNIYLKK